jgi:hypothetical protein
MSSHDHPNMAKSMAKLHYEVQKEVATVGAISPGGQITNKRLLQDFRLVADTWKDYHMAALALVDRGAFA